MASGGIMQTPTRLSAEALGRSNVVLINAANCGGKFLRVAEAPQVPCRSPMARKSAARVLVSQLWSLPQDYSRDIGRPFIGRSGAKYPRRYKSKNNFLLTTCQRREATHTRGPRGHYPQ